MARVRAAVLALGMVVATGCESTEVWVPGPGGGPDAPRALQASYYAGEVTLTWELGPGWDGEAFRVYSKRVSDPDWYLISEVTSCAAGICTYLDTNVLQEVDYDYYVAAVDEFGVETASRDAVRVRVPRWVAPPAPGGTEAVALDAIIYLRWNDRSRDAQDFSFYRVWLWDGADAFLLGETDSEGFLDERVANGNSYEYFVTAVDLDGHESEGSVSAVGTPRPDYHGELLRDWFTDPARAGFVFRADEFTDPVVGGSDARRHFRLEVDSEGWWLVPGSGVTVHPTAWETTALKCGPGSDADCVDLEVAPTSGYVAQDLGLEPQTSYVLRVPGPDGRLRYATVRVSLLGYDQSDRPLMIFDWAWQLQVGNPALSKVGGGAAATIR